MVLPLLFGAGVNLLSGAMRNRAQRRANNDNIAFQRETNDTNWKRQQQVNEENRAYMDRVNSENRAFARELNAQAQANFETGRADEKLARETALQTMVADAQKAGLNPLTAMRGGGVQAFSYTQPPALMSSSSEAALKQATRDVAPQIDPETGAAEAISNLGGTMFSMFANQPDPEREALEKSLLYAELENIQKSNEALTRHNFGYDIPSVVEKAGLRHGPVDGGGFVGFDGRMDSASDMGADTPSNPIGEIPVSTVAGVDLKGSGRYSSGQQYEDAYGEAVSWPLGVAAFLDNVGYTAGRKISEWKEERFFRDLYRQKYDYQPRRSFGRGTSMPFLATNGVPDQWFYN